MFIVARTWNDSWLFYSRMLLFNFLAEVKNVNWVILFRMKLSTKKTVKLCQIEFYRNIWRSIEILSRVSFEISWQTITKRCYDATNFSTLTNYPLVHFALHDCLLLQGPWAFSCTLYLRIQNVWYQVVISERNRERIRIEASGKLVVMSIEMKGELLYWLAVIWIKDWASWLFVKYDLDFWRKGMNRRYKDFYQDVQLFNFMRIVVPV